MGSQSKKPALGAVLHKMQRPAKQCDGLNAGPWQASVERMREAEARKHVGIDSRPVPSWNFRFNGKGALDGADSYLSESHQVAAAPSSRKVSKQTSSPACLMSDFQVLATD